MTVLILGGGISGLSAAWFLQKKEPQTKITLLEKQERLGGWIETKREGGFLFEKGPRTFQVGRSAHLLALIRDLGLEEELLFSHGPSKRYLLHRGRLCSFFPSLIPVFLREAFVPASHLEEESIYDFAVRRFNAQVAENFFDPLTLGIFGGDIRKLSVHSCFPKFVEWERKRGSLLRGMLTAPKREKGLFTLKRGMASLIETLQNKIKADFVFNCPVEAIRPGEVIAGGKSWSADRIYVALPLKEAGKLFGEDFSMTSLWVANIGFKTQVLKKQGFGYLVPSQEKQSLLGVIWDSSIFPQGEGTRLTAMMRAPDEEFRFLREHLGIEQKPTFVSQFQTRDAIPQFELGYAKKLAHFQGQVQKKITLLGNYFGGASVEAAIERSFKEMSTN